MIRADGSRYESDWRNGKRLVPAAPEPERPVQQRSEERQTRLAANSGNQRPGSPSSLDSKAEEQGLRLTRTMRKHVQSCLTAEGFNPGPSYGMFGPRTRGAFAPGRRREVRTGDRPLGI